MKTFTKEMQDNITPEKSLEKLVEGNNRFIQSMSINRNFLQQAEETEKGQYPFAVILSCIDSRAPTEIIFDFSHIFKAYFDGVLHMLRFRARMRAAR